MRILLSNKFYYPRGGPEIYMIELEKLFKEHGHDVGIFAMQHPLNLETEYSVFFPSEVDMNQKELKNLISVAIRPFGSAEVKEKFTKLLKYFKPEIVILNNIHSQLSPVLAVLAHRNKIPVLWTVHDHKLLCPRYDCMRDGKTCELCFNDNFNVVRFRCMKNSMPASLLAFFEARVWNTKVLSESTDLFICPSSFLQKNMIKGGFKTEKLKVISNFVSDKKLSDSYSEKENFYCYLGRLSKEKGVETLLRAAAELPDHELRVIGTGPLEQELKAKYNKPNIKFLGFRTWEEFKTILERSQCMVIPSECYENNPLSIIESLCTGTPVIGARIGGISELIDSGVNGFTFEPGNVADLKYQINNLFQSYSNFDYSEIGKTARSKFSGSVYYREIIEVCDHLLH
jgi:glycosyltransferase involved in cell wall biosynthesis